MWTVVQTCALPICLRHLGPPRQSPFHLPRSGGCRSAVLLPTAVLSQCLHTVGCRGRAVQRAEPPFGDAALRQTAAMDALRIFRHAVPGGPAGGRLVSAELAVLPGGHHAARYPVAARPALPACRHRRLPAGARPAALSRGGRVCRALLLLLRRVCGTQFAPRDLPGIEPRALALVERKAGGARSEMAAGDGHGGGRHRARRPFSNRALRLLRAE